MGNQPRERTEYMFCTMYVTASFSFFFFLNFLMSAFITLNLWAFYVYQSVFNEIREPGSGTRCRTCRWLISCPRWLHCQRPTSRWVLLIRLCATKLRSHKSFNSSSFCLKVGITCSWFRPYQDHFKNPCFISSRSGRGKKEMWPTTTQLFKWVRNKNHNRMCHPFEFGI